MKHRSAVFGIYLPIFILLLITTVILRTVSIINYMDPYGYFTEKTLPTVSNALIIFGVALFLIYPLFERKDIRLIASFSSPANFVPSALVSTALLFISLHLFEVASVSTQLVQKYCALIAGVFALLSIVFFIYNTIYIRNVSAKRANLSICTTVFLCLYVAYIYFDTTLPINSHSKIVDQMAYLFATVFFLYETRLSLGREKWRSYIMFGFIASLLTAYSAFPTLITYFVNGRLVSDSIYESALTLTLFIFITSKLLLTKELIEDKTSPVVEKLIQSASLRDAEVNPVTEEPIPDEISNEEESNDENQLTIEEMDGSVADDALSEDAQTVSEPMAEQSETNEESSESEETFE